MITFTKLRWKNFLSTGNSFTEITLNEVPLTIVYGENGAGKSTLIDAVCFGLFGKPFRNINKPQLVNSINKKDMLVEIEFTIGSNHYLVRRGIKPNVFEIIKNDEKFNEDANAREQQEYLENNILQLNFKSFTQIVVLGSRSYIPFMQLTAQQRREVVEDLLDINVFSSMSTLLKPLITENKNGISSVSSTLEDIKQKAAIHSEYLEKQKDDKEKIINDMKSEVDGVIKNIDQLEELRKDKVSELDKWETKPSTENVSDKISDAKTVIDTHKNQLSKIRKEIKFYDDHDICPTCTQEIDGDFIANKKKELVNESKTNIETIEEKEKLLQELVKEKEKINNDLDEYNKISREVVSLDSDLKNLKQSVDNINKKIEKAESETNNDEYITNVKKELTEISKKGQELVEEKKRLTSDKSILDIASVILKDTGIKSVVVKQYVPILNNLINEYLEKLDFFVGFEFDENFNETILSRHRDSFTYNSFSEGEKSRLDLALIFTWRTIATLKNSIHTNLLIMDEVFDGPLDKIGVDLFSTILGDNGKSNIIVISHRTEYKDKFARSIEFKKDNNFSVMEISDE